MRAEQSQLLRVLKQRQFAALCAGASASAFGDAISPIMLAFAVLGATHSVAYLGLVVGSRAAAHVAMLVFAGVAADRLPRARVMTFSCAASVVSQALLAVAAAWTPASHTWMIGAAVINGATTAFYAPAAMGQLPDTVDAADLVPANSMYRILCNGANILGTICASILIGFVEPGVGLIVDAGTFAVATVIFALVRPTPTTHDPDKSIWANLADGWSVFWRSFWIKATIGAFAVINFAFAAAYFVLGPAVATAGLGKSSWSLISAAQAGGFLLGGLAALRMPRRHVLTYGLLCCMPFSAFLIALGARGPLLLLFVLSLIAGIGLELFNVSWQVVLQHKVDRRYLSRISAYDQLGSFVAIPLGELVTGPVASSLGVSPSLYVFGISCAVICCLVAVAKSIREVDVLASPEPLRAASVTR